MTSKRKKGLVADRWRHLFETTIRQEEIKAFTGFDGDGWEAVVPAVRAWRHFVVDQPVTGAAPKSFLRVYEHISPTRDNPLTWPAYIAKVGNKRYPSESFTEQLMTRIGETIGVRMARSRLMVCDGQIRFLSRYFLRPTEQLFHGSDILGGYLQDPTFIQAVGEEKLERDVITFADCCQALHFGFEGFGDEIAIEFVKMIGFDALVGNQDRHMQNWGVITDLAGRQKPRFSPVYDTARGLFWNEHETQLSRYESKEGLSGYVDRAQPLIGCDGVKKPNHFDLVGALADMDEKYRRTLSRLCVPGYLNQIEHVIESEFGALFSQTRRRIILSCVKMRFELFSVAVGAKS